MTEVQVFQFSFYSAVYQTTKNIGESNVIHPLR